MESGAGIDANNNHHEVSSLIKDNKPGTRGQTSNGKQKHYADR